MHQIPFKIVSKFSLGDDKKAHGKKKKKRQQDQI